MATPQEEFEKKVTLILESTIKGMTETLAALRTMKGLLKEVGEASDAMTRSTASLTSSLASTTKEMNKLSRKSKHFKQIAKGAIGAAKAVGGIFVTAVKTGIGVLATYGKEAKRVGDTMLKFQITALDASSAIDSLSRAYGSLNVQAGSAVLSMQDVAKSLSKFQSKGIAERVAATSDAFKTGFADIQNAVSMVLGKGAGDEIMGRLTEAMTDSFGEFERNIVGRLGKVAGEFRKATEPDIRAGHLDEIIGLVLDLKVFTNDAGVAADDLANSFVVLRDATLGIGEPVVVAAVAINTALGTLGRMLTNLSQKIIEALGPSVASMLNVMVSTLSGPLSGAMEQIVRAAADMGAQLNKWVESGDFVTFLKETIADATEKLQGFIDKFNEWGGMEQLIKSLVVIFGKMFDLMVGLGGWVLKIGGWFLEANTSGKVLMATVTAMAFAPGLLPSVYLLGKGLMGAATSGKAAMIAIKAARAAQAAGGAATTIGGGLGADMAMTAGMGLAAGTALVGAAGIVGHLGGGALAGAVGVDEEGLGGAAIKASTAALAGAAMGSVVFPVLGTAIGAAIAGGGSLLYSGITAWMKSSEDNINDATKSIIPKPEETEDMKVLREQKEAADKIKAETARKAQIELDEFDKFTSKMKKLETHTKRTIPGLSGSLSEMNAIIDTLGPSTEMFGKSMSEIMKSTGIEAMNHGYKAMAISAETAAIAQAEIAKYLAQDTPEGAARAAQWTIKLQKALKAGADAAKLVNQGLEAGLKPLEKYIEKVQAIKELRQLDLEISQQLYGAPALAVGAALALVDTIQKEKDLRQEELDFVQQTIAARLAQGATEKDIFVHRMKELKLSKDIKSLTAEQLKQVKELRDGYLDAVQAQAFGAGRFSKLILTQEANAGKALQQGAFKANYLLGQVGEDAGRVRAESARFSATGGYGAMVGADGQPLDLNDIAQQRVDSISDPAARAAAQQGKDAFMGMMRGASKNTQQLGSIVSQGTDRTVDAINALGETLVKTTAAGKALGSGTPAGVTAIGSEVDKLMRGKHTPTAPGFAKTGFAATPTITPGLPGLPEPVAEAVKESASESLKRDPGAFANKWLKHNFSPGKANSGFASGFGGGTSRGGGGGGGWGDEEDREFDLPGGFASGFGGGTSRGHGGGGGWGDEGGPSGWHPPMVIPGFDKEDMAKKEKKISEEVKATTEKQLKQVQQLKANGGKAPGMPMLTAVDTDEFMGKKGAANVPSRYGAKSGFVDRKNKIISDLDEKIKKVSSKILPGSTLMGPRQEMVGPIAPKILAQQDRERKQQDRLMRKKGRLEKSRKKQQDALHKVTEAVDRPLREQAERAAQARKFQAQARKDQAMGRAAAGLGYTGVAPKRVQGVTLPTDVLPAGAMGPTGPGQRQQLSGVSDSTRIRTLSHGSSGSSKNELQKELKEAVKHLSKAASAAGIMGPPAPSEITETGSGRTNYVQSITP